MEQVKTHNRSFFRWIAVIAVFIMTLIVSIAVIACSSDEPETVNTQELAYFQSAGPTTYVGADYVGSEECADCHWDLYDSWRTTLHTKKIQVADETTVIGDFIINNELTVTVTANSPQLAGEVITTEMYMRDGKYYARTIGPDYEFHEYEISHVLGIAWKQRYVTIFPNGEMQVLPIQWNVSTKVWTDYHGLASRYPGKGDYWSDPGRIWQLKCGSCHVTGLEINYDLAMDTFDTTWADNGAACEACHGPGSNHVEAASEYFEYESETIVNPAKIPAQIGAMACGQCHNRGASIAEVSPYEEGFPTNYGFPYDFQPGEMLYLNYVEKPGLWPDESAKKHHQQYIDWNNSEMVKSGVMCWDCHEVHSEGESNNKQTVLSGSSLCISCHSEPRETTGLGGLTHTIHDLGSCLSCHMPYTAKTSVNGDIRSHTFNPIKPQATIDVLVEKAMEKNESVLDWYGLQPADVDGLSKADVNDLLRAKALEAEEEGKIFTGLMFSTQVNSCNLCHEHEDDSPWELQEVIQDRY